MLRIYNTLSREKEVFEPLDPPRVTFYNCGPTVYDYFHIGNARNFILADIVRRYLRFKGYKVKFVQNITDIDDKIIRRSMEEGCPAAEIAERYSRAYFDHSARLGIEPPDVSPRATDHIPQMIAFIEKLIEKGYAYRADGDVFYRVRRFADYGKLSGKKLDELHEGKRVEVDPRKEDPRDFDLWKAAKPGEPSWPSPWGRGRPGWHIECSVMAMAHLGETIDIHSGGSDLQFPHHENEIAQSEAATGKVFVRYWVHNAFLNIGGEKMSKSLGNIVTIDQVLARYDPMVVRYFFLSAHYRRPMDYGPESLEESRKALGRLVGGIETVEKLLALIARRGGTEPKSPTERDRDALEGLRRRFCDFMDDDFNTPRALSVLFEAVSDLHERRRRFEDGAEGPAMRAFARAAIALIGELAGVLGLDLSPRRTAPAISTEPLLAILSEALGEVRKGGMEEIRTYMVERMARIGFIADEGPDGPTWRPLGEARGGDPFAPLVEVALDVRNRARREKRFALADRIRSALAEAGIVLEDYRSGTIWRFDQ